MITNDHSDATACLIHTLSDARSTLANPLYAWTRSLVPQKHSRCSCKRELGCHRRGRSYSLASAST
jgi:hypothetical protein